MVDVRRSPSATPQVTSMPQSAFVVVAHRLPVDDGRGGRHRVPIFDTGADRRVAAQPRRPDQRAAPDPRAHADHLGRVGRPARAGAHPRRHRRGAHARRRAGRRGRRGPLRGVRQRHAVAALPRRRRAAGLPPALVGGLPAGQPAVRGGGRRRRRAGRRGVGAGLPPAARAGTAPRAPARPADRVLPPRPVPATGAVHAAAPARRAAAPASSAPTWSGSSAPRPPTTSPSSPRRCSSCTPPTAGSRWAGATCGSARSPCRSTSRRWSGWPTARR